MLLAIGVAPAAGESASEPSTPAAAQIDVGLYHSCAILPGGSVRCWGEGAQGQLGYGTTTDVGDDETPASRPVVDLGQGHTAKAISAGDSHTCAVLDDGKVRCWGFGAEGRLGYGNTRNVGDDETPGSVDPVDLGPGAKAVAIAAGSGHTCALLVDASVYCWGFGTDGSLGYAKPPCMPADCPEARTFGDDESPAAAGPVNLSGHGALAISAGDRHTCALLDDRTVRCWGVGTNGQLGYPSTSIVYDASTVEAVNLGGPAAAISAGRIETCAVLMDGTVRCWGFGGNGRLGLGNTTTVGDNETPADVPAVNLGGAKAKGISVGAGAVCARLEDATLRCWGYGVYGQLGYGFTNDIGDDEDPASAGPVPLGGTGKAQAVSVSGAHTCARLEDGRVRCFGAAANGRLGYCNPLGIGDDETAGSAGPVNLVPGDGGTGDGGTGDGGTGCVAVPTASPSPGPATSGLPSATPLPTVPTPAPGGTSLAKALAAQAQRAQDLRRCLTHLSRKAKSARRRCLARYGRTPGRVGPVAAEAISGTEVKLSFDAPGTDASRPPAAKAYLIKQSLRPSARARILCKGACRFSVSTVGQQVSLTVTDLRPHTTYYYRVAARDNVSERLGPASQTVKVRTL